MSFGLHALSSSLVSYFHLQPFSLSPHLFPPSLVLFGSSFSFVESFSLFFRADFYSSLFFGVCPFHYWRPIFFLLWLLLFRATVFISFALRFFSLSRLSSVPAPLLRCFCYTCCFCLLGGSPLTCISFTLPLFCCPWFPINYLLRLPVPPPPSGLLIASLGVSVAVQCASFFLSPFFSSWLLSGWGIVHQSVPSFMGFPFRWQCSSLAWAVGSHGSGIDFLGSCCSLSLIGVVNLFLVLTPSPVRFGPFLVQCLFSLLPFPLRFVSELPLLPSVPLSGAPIPVWGVLAPITRCLDASSSGSSLLFLGLGLLISCSVF